MGYLKIFLFYIVCLLIPLVVQAKDAASYFEEAYEIEKSSPLFAIPLYENILNNIKNKDINKTAISRLFYLYVKYNMYEEVFLFNKKHSPNKSRKKNTSKIIEKLSKRLGLSPLELSSIISLAVSADKSTHPLLVEKYKLKPSIELFHLIFSIKMKVPDTEGIAYLLSESPNANPIFRLAYFLKAKPESLRKAFFDMASISALSTQQKMDMLYLYGLHLRNQRRYKLSARYLWMSSSYNPYKRKNYIDISTVELAKTLIISGRSSEACSFLKPGKILIRNEGDELLDLYCKQKNTLKIKKLKPSLQILAQRENGLFFKKILRIIN